MKTNELPENYILNGQYEIVEVIGTGAYGITYKAIEPGIERPVAIKEFFPQSCASRDNLGNVRLDLQEDEEWYKKAKERFIAEAKVLLKMKKNPDTIQVNNLFEKNNTAYMVMEFVEGKTLEQYLEEYEESHNGDTMPIQKIYDILIPFLETISIIHDNKIIHRDINPWNILINNKGKAVLIDFGNAKEQPTGTRSSVVFSNQGKKGAYLAPEIYYCNKEQGPWSDIYSLCGVMFYMITGQEPANSVSENKMVLDRFEVSEAMKAGILKGLLPEPDKRPQDVRELIAFLNGAFQIKKYLLFLIVGLLLICSIPILFQTRGIKVQPVFVWEREGLKSLIEQQSQHMVVDELATFDDFNLDGQKEMFALVAVNYNQSLVSKNIYFIEHAEIWYSDGKRTVKAGEIKKEENGNAYFYEANSLQVGKEKLWQLIRYYDAEKKRIHSVEIYKMNSDSPEKVKYIQSIASPVFADNNGHYLIDYINGGFTNGGFSVSNKVYIRYNWEELKYYFTEELLWEELETYRNFSSVYKKAEGQIMNGESCYVQFFSGFRCKNGFLYLNMIRWPKIENYEASILGGRRIWKKGQLPLDFQDDQNIGENYYAVLKEEADRLWLEEIRAGFWVYPADDNEKISIENWGLKYRDSIEKEEFTNQEAWEAYKDYLEVQMEYQYFSIKDINNDGIDELFCANNLKEDIEFGMNLPMLHGKVGCMIFGYSGKEIVTITEFTPEPQSVVICLGENGIYWSSRFQTELLRIADNQISETEFWSQTPNGIGLPKKYFVNGQEVTEEEYYQSFDVLEGMKEIEFQENPFLLIP